MAEQASGIEDHGIAVSGSTGGSVLRRSWPQPVLGVAALGAALVVLLGSALGALTIGVSARSAASAVLSCGLVGALVLAQRFPIHARTNTKILLTSIPLYLVAVLLPVPLATATAMVGLAIGELMLRTSRGGFYSDVAAQVGRMTVVVFVASLVAHIPAHAVLTDSLTLVGAAAVLWTGDILTGPVLFAPITGESPRTIIVDMVRQLGMLEGAQYLVGILGATAAQRLPWTVVLVALPAALVYIVGRHVKELQETTRLLLESMADAVDLRDSFTGGHSRRVTEYIAGILQVLGMSGPDVTLIVAAARVHDIGKIGIPDSVLLKDGPLTDEERAIMNAHPEHGAELLKGYADFARGVEIVRHHHERWDGEGYPHRLRETAIPFGARVIAVADGFDAMTSDRPYRKGMSVTQAAVILRRERGRQWDAAIVDAFLQSIADRLERPALHLVPAAEPIEASAVTA